MDDTNSRSTLPRSARAALGFLMLVALTSVCLLVTECSLRTFVYPTVDRSVKGWARQLFKSNQNSYLTAVLPLNSHCLFDDITTKHADYIFVLDSNGPCKLPGVNRQGFRTYEFPYSRQPEFFSILVLGASVADMLAARHNGITPSLLEQLLNRDWTDPQGRPFRVYDGSIGGARLPSQEQILLRHAVGFDAVIALDAGNELVMMRSKSPVDAPDAFPYLIHTKTYPARSRILYALRLRLEKVSIETFLADSILFQAVANLVGQAAIHDFDAYHSSPKGYTYDFGHHFDLPDAWNEDQLIKFNIDRYVRYSQNLHAIAAANGVKSLHFIQPISAHGKPLSNEEQKIVPLRNSDLYRDLEAETLRRLKGKPTYSLVDIFEKHTETIYADPIHPIWVSDLNLDRGGYTLIGKAIVERASIEWGLKKKKPAESQKPISKK